MPWQASMTSAYKTTGKKRHTWHGIPGGTMNDATLDLVFWHTRPPAGFRPRLQVRKGRLAYATVSFLITPSLACLLATGLLR
jgi:hypothetical protein